MMESMIEENSITFKTLENEIFRCVCRMGAEWTRQILEEMDRRLKEARDRSRYRDKGFRTTTIKTIYIHEKAQSCPADERCMSGPSQYQNTHLAESLDSVEIMLEPQS